MDLSAFTADIDDLLAAFVEMDGKELAQMKELWRSRSFTFIHEARPSHVNPGFFMQALYSCALDYMGRTSQWSRKLGGLYVLYILYETQLFVPPFKIYLSTDLHLLSWNVNGMHFTSPSGPRKLRLRREISTHVSTPVVILLVQEHKLSYAHTHRCGKLLLGGSHTFWEPVVGDHLSSGGVCIFVGSRWLARVIDHVTLVPGRAMWITLQCDASIVGVLCIYAPTTAGERSWFWDQIVDVLPSVVSWIVGGDFNNVETFEDWRAAQRPAVPYVARCERCLG
ncbi:hypothetical protein L7F22_059716 [Adiantum nelumboides]|nr:hypothetical protein [Adiantum nelumboides]